MRDKLSEGVYFTRFLAVRCMIKNSDLAISTISVKIKSRDKLEKIARNQNVYGRKF
ncbi:hypothetical protein IGI37_000407 [Enterococcus sp. AZ194]